ncbi:HAD-IA family hydrolase [Acuticoccus sp. M5D2P5]|uniref:HAD family hydrolase n=1 Tax=Acuticoccus kalidii TaxID=2910977 RepID=UPI001F3D87FA|nr:HAD-IA family hydrolase [Acuticoccus kalidii]MCF3932177.1 HAD-IA family hydrolase [Acuticoccus kalidii]
MSDITLDRSRYDGAVFDMDGVITTTVGVHEAAWRRVFEPALAAHGDPLPFTHADYRAHVDGKARAVGVRDFFAARRISLDEAEIARIAAAKNEAFLAALEATGVAPLDGVVPLLRALRAAEMKVGLFSASRNARHVLTTAGVLGLFDAIVDGVVAAEEGLRSKPAPDLPLALAARLALRPDRTVLFEDAVAGIEAGRAGGFALVVGVANAEDAPRLRAAGAHTIIAALSEAHLDRSEEINI